MALKVALVHGMCCMQYPYYKFKDKQKMYTIGSLFYAIYFLVSFPVFYVMDEQSRAPKTPVRSAAWNALASAMLVTIILDLWRVLIGPIYSSDEKSGLPFMREH
jgi:cycloeucalenol cycloisomerase